MKRAIFSSSSYTSPKVKKFFLPMRQSELAHGVAEQQSEVGLHVLQRVDAEAVDVEPRDQVLMRADERVAHRKALASPGPSRDTR